MASDPVVRLGRRRALQGSLILLGLAVLSGCASVSPAARLPQKVHRIGFLMAESPEGAGQFVVPIVGALGELGYVEGQNLAVEIRFAHGQEERLPSLAADLVQANVDVIVPQGTPASRAAKGATGTIPIVTATTDPVGTGLVESLARPGGNVTGTTNYNPELTGKKLQLLRELIPGASRIAFLTNPNNPTYAAQEKELKDGAVALGVALQRLEVRVPADLEPAFRAATDGRAEAVMVLADSLLLLGQRVRIAQLAIDTRLPTMVPDRPSTEAGGLISYAEDRPALQRTRAIYIDKILKGAKPADLAMQGPTQFDLLLNQRTARALGLTIPPSVLQQATEIIQ